MFCEMGGLNMGIGINGMGRIGRLVLRRLASDSKLMESMPVKAINMSYPAETIAHLLKYDTTHGKLNGTVEVGDGESGGGEGWIQWRHSRCGLSPRA